MTAFRQQVQVFIDRNLSPAARTAILAETAREGRDSLILSGRASPDFQTFVDGRQGVDESQVRGTGGGTILYRFDVQAQAAVFALAFLQARGPSRSGAFRSSFYVGINGRFVPASAFNPDSVPAGAEITIGNTKPYARKIDVQIGEGGKALHFSVPAGMFDDCVTALKARFGSAIVAKRVYSLKFPGQYVLHKGRNPGSAVQSPAVVISAVT